MSLVIAHTPPYSFITAARQSRSGFTVAHSSLPWRDVPECMYLTNVCLKNVVSKNKRQ